MPPGVAITNASTVVENTSPKNVRSQSCSVVNASSSVVVTRKTVPEGAKVAIRLAAPRQKKAQPPGMRIKASKKKKKTRTRAVIGLSSFRECLWTRQGPGSKITKTWL